MEYRLICALLPYGAQMDVFINHRRRGKEREIQIYWVLMLQRRWVTEICHHFYLKVLEAETIRSKMRTWERSGLPCDQKCLDDCGDVFSRVDRFKAYISRSTRRKVLLRIDNCSAHGTISSMTSLSNVKVFLLPAKTTSHS